MKSIRIVSSLVAVTIVGMCGDLHAQDPRFSASLVKILNSNPEIRIFPIKETLTPVQDGNQQQERSKDYMRTPFIDAQRQNAKRLTDSQTRDLLKILVNPGNYHDLLCFWSTPNPEIGFDIKTPDDSASLTYAKGCVFIYEKGDVRHIHFLSKEGRALFNQWIDGYKADR